MTGSCLISSHLIGRIYEEHHDWKRLRHMTKAHDRVLPQVVGRVFEEHHDWKRLRHMTKAHDRVLPHLVNRVYRERHVWKRLRHMSKAHDRVLPHLVGRVYRERHVGELHRQADMLDEGVIAWHEPGSLAPVLEVHLASPQTLVRRSALEKEGLSPNPSR
jgi:predicted DNA-binding ribbon-helix-helix protein